MRKEEEDVWDIKTGADVATLVKTTEFCPLVSSDTVAKYLLCVGSAPGADAGQRKRRKKIV